MEAGHEGRRRRRRRGAKTSSSGSPNRTCRGRRTRFPGLLGNVVAGRIANRLDLGGTNCVVDAACASSLSAVHLAALELQAGRADVVVTGGIDTFNDIFMYMCFSKTPALSPTGNAKPFDANGDGTILGEGLGMVVLKRLPTPSATATRIYAVIRGIGSSSDGKGNAIYAPSAEGQSALLADAYRVAGVTPDTIELVEAHGTGTKVGDADRGRGADGSLFRRRGESGALVRRRFGQVADRPHQGGGRRGRADQGGAGAAHKVLPPTIKVDQPLAALRGGPIAVLCERASAAVAAAGRASAASGGQRVRLRRQQFPLRAGRIAVAAARHRLG